MATVRSGVVGHPVAHSLSPIMHNAAYKHLGLDWNYEAIDLEPANAREGISDIFNQGCGGLNVTMPHKYLAFKISIAHGAANRLESVNTLIADDKGSLHGYSTDGDGIVNFLSSQNIDSDGMRILVIGAGGAARAICDSLVQVNANVLVTARKLDQSLNIVEAVMAHQTIGKSRIQGTLDIVDWSVRNNYIQECDLVINATPVGMTKEKKRDTSTPIDTSKLASNQIVLDTIYHPIETELLTQASEIGCKTFNGIGMLIHQGALAFNIMTGEKAPLEIMEKAIREHLREDESGIS